jgi:ABC-type lipoprotein release transport system permease subunit
MGRILLVVRLAARDLRRRPAEAALLLLAITAATTTLTIALVLRGVTSDPYLSTRAATAGPDVVVGAGPTGRPGQPPDGPADLAGLEAQANAPGVTGHSGPYPVVFADLAANGRTGSAFAIGRETAPSAIDRPELTEGSWVADGAVVVEAAFADALGVGEDDHIDLNGRSFRVAGVAITAATPPYPEIYCFVIACWERTGVVWLTESDALSLPPPLTAAPDGTRERELAYVMYLDLADATDAPAFVDARLSESGTLVWIGWQEIRDETAELVRNQRQALVIGSRLIGLLAVASVAVLVGGRMADQARRVGLLKAVGGTPGLAAAVLLAEYVAIALLAAAAGLAAGWLSAPLLTDPSIGLLGRAGTPPLSVTNAVQVTAVALVVAVAATLIPAIRASRTSTVLALADAARTPRRTAWLIAVSRRLPVPLLLGLRMAARRPRRLVLSTASIFVTISGIVAALGANAVSEVDRVDEFGLPSTREAQLDQALLMITITLVALAAVNAVVITSATVIDNRHASALARAVGATPHDVSAGLCAAQLLPALVGTLLGIPGGIALLDFVSEEPIDVPLWQSVAVVPTTALVVTALTIVPARLGARRSVAETLRSEFA